MSTDVSVDLVRALIDNMRGAAEDWASLAMVIDLRGGRISGTHGYAYAPDGGISAVASRPSGITPAVDAYLASHYTAEQERPVALLVQFDRDSGTYEVTFEDEDASRWKVTPANIDRIGAELRPDFS